MTEVFVTGMSALGAHGLSLEALHGALMEGVPLRSPIPTPPEHVPKWRCDEAALCPEDLDWTPWLPPRAARRMSTLSRWAVVSGRRTLEHAGWPAEDPQNGTDLAVCLGSCFGPSDFVNQLLIQVLRDGPTAASPFLFTDCVANAPSGQLAIAVGARGANFTISQREASALLTMIQATWEIRAGRAGALLVGSIDEVDYNQVSVLDRMRALAPSDAPVAPFDAGRRGMMLGEGAGCLLVESEASVAARGGTPLARIAACVRGFDPTAERAGFGTDATALAAALQRQLAHQGVDLDSIDAVVSGASGSRLGDALEGRVLRAAFGDHLPPILVPKAVVGEYGVGGVLVPGMLALRGGAFAPPAGFQTVDPELGIALGPVHLEAPRRVLLSTLATGGAAAWIVLESPA